MASDDLLSQAMFACTLDETGIPGYRPAALRLLEAHDMALREQVRVLREALEIAVGAYDSAYPGALRTVIATMRAALAATAQEEKP